MEISSLILASGNSDRFDAALIEEVAAEFG